jgi:hypothetical protein
MKTPFIIQKLAVVSMVAASAALTPAITSPETNALVSEVEIGAPTALAEGRFGQLIAARSNLVVIGYRTTFESNPSGPLAAVYRKSAVPRNFDFQGELRVPGVTNLSVLDLHTDGNRIAITASTAGADVTYLFEYDGTQWILESTFGFRLSAMTEDILVAVSGHTVPVYEKTNGSWHETIILPPANSPVSSGFGSDVAIQGDNILVGATGFNLREDEGHAYIYSRVDGAWRLQADLTAGESFIGYHHFGTRVAIEGDTALVTHYSGRFNSGHVDVFEKSDLGWSKVGVVSSSYGNEDYFGLNLAIGGKNILVGTPEIAWGMAYLFRKNGEVFDRLHLSQAPYHGEYPEDAFGTSVAVDGNTVYVGAPLYDGSVTNQGVAYAFEFDFSPHLHSVWARHSDNSFHFTVSELQVGKIYTVETCSSLGTEWTFVKEFTAYAPDIELDVGISTGSGSWFFRVLEN